VSSPADSLPTGILDPREAWCTPSELGVLPADGPGGLVAPVLRLRGVEISEPDRALLTTEELAQRWWEARERHRARLALSEHEFNGPMPLVRRFDPLSGELVWYLADYSAHVASRELLRLAGGPLPGMDLAPSVLVLVACTEGWVRSRRSAKTTLPFHWQHAAAETLTAEDLRGELDLRAVAARALHEEFALELPAARFTPWLVQCQGVPGAGAGYVFYVVADLRELSLARIRSSQRRAGDAWEIDTVSAASLPRDWDGFLTLPRMLLPFADPGTWFLGQAGGGVRPEGPLPPS